MAALVFVRRCARCCQYHPREWMDRSRNCVLTYGDDSMIHPLTRAVLTSYPASTSKPASTQAFVPPATFIRFVKPACCMMLVAALERKPPAQMTATGSVG